MTTRYGSLSPAGRAALAQNNPALFAQLRAEHQARESELVRGITAAQSYTERSRLVAELEALRAPGTLRALPSASAPVAPPPIRASRANTSGMPERAQAAFDAANHARGKRPLTPAERDARIDRLLQLAEQSRGGFGLMASAADAPMVTADQLAAMKEACDIHDELTAHWAARA